MESRFLMLRSGPLHVPYVGCGEAVAGLLIQHAQITRADQPVRTVQATDHGTHQALEVISFNHAYIELLVRSAVRFWFRA